MQAAVAAILEGMPDPADLRVHEHGGEVAVMAGSRVLACYPAGDAVMRNMTAVVLTGLGFPGKDVAAALGLTPVYVSMLRSRARGEGSAGLARRRGRPATLGASALQRARSYRAGGMADAEIGRRLGVHGTTVARWLGPRQPAAEPLFPGPGAGPETGPAGEPEPEEEPAAGPEPPPAAGAVPAGFRAAGG